MDRVGSNSLTAAGWWECRGVGRGRRFPGDRGRETERQRGQDRQRWKPRQTERPREKADDAEPSLTWYKG